MRIFAVIIFLSVSVMLGNTTSSWADDIYLYINGIPGEATDTSHTDWINLLSWEWQASNNAQLNGGSTGGAPIIRPLIVQKYIDKASPLLALAALTGQHIDSAILVSVMEGGDRHTRVQITMQNVIVSNIAPAGAAGSPTLESLALRFGMICYRYIPIDSTGAPGAFIEKCFDVLANQEP